MKVYLNIACWLFCSIVIALFAFRKFVSVVKSLINMSVVKTHDCKLIDDKRGMLTLGLSRRIKFGFVKGEFINLIIHAVDCQI